MNKSLCTKELYSTFLRVTSQRYSALSLSEVSPVELSHDSISRWLSDAKCQPKDIWNEAKPQVLSTLGVLIVDDTILDKSRSDKIELVRYQYSGTVHDVIRGIGMLNFLWVDQENEVNPMDVRIYEPKEDGKTKNDHFREMLQLAKERGVKPEAVIADSWYSSLDNLKCIRDFGWNFVMGLRKNRVVNKNQKLCDLDIPDEGLRIHLRGYGWITVFRFVSTERRTDYVGTNLENPTRDHISALVKKRWEIEVFHRELKQTCGLEHCQARTSRAQRNHIVLCVLTWIKQAALRKHYNISFYQQQWNVIKDAIALQMKIALVPT
jgi:hypothetical protein